MLKTSLLMTGFITLAGMTLLEPAQADSLPNLTGTYRCEPQPAPCRSGQTFTVAQSEATLELKSDTGTSANAKLTSNISLSAGPPWNMLGVILPENGGIEWSNGTRWRKQ